MSNDKSLAIIPRTIEECTDLAERLSQSSLLPKAMQGKMPDVLVTIIAGQEMGLAPMASLRAIHVIEGKPVLSADGMIAIILGSGKAQYFERVEESDTSVTYETLRIGAKSPRRCTWTIAQAKAAALHLKDNWRGYPRAMLASRAKAELARDVYPDVLAGCYTPDEIDSSGPRPEYKPQAVAHADVPDAEIVTESTAEPSELSAIDAADSVESLKALAPELNKLTGEWKQKAKDRYKARLEVIRASNGATA